MMSIIERKNSGAVKLPRTVHSLTDDEIVRAEGRDCHISYLLRRRMSLDTLDEIENELRDEWRQLTGYGVGYGLFLAKLWFTLNERPERAYRLFEHLITGRSGTHDDVRFALMEWSDRAGCEHLLGRARFWFGRVTIACRDAECTMPTVTARAMVAVDLAMSEETECTEFASKALVHARQLCAARQSELRKPVFPPRACPYCGSKVVLQ